MWRIEERTRAREAPDLARFVETVNAHADFFDPGAPISIARAPGRLDLMGGIADYSGSLVLELPLAVATFVATQPTTDGCLTVRSLAPLGTGSDMDVSIPVDAIAPGGAPLDYEEARALLAADPRRRWAAYILGALIVLGRERSVRITGGLRLLVGSTVPLGKGVSSSAALEVAAMNAICAVAGATLGPRDLALLCQMVENRVVGAPCGVMDQMTAACGERDRLLALLCQPAELQPPVALPPTIDVWGIDSGIRHEVGGADYNAVRVGAFMGYRMIVEKDATTRGYLANVTPSEWESSFRDAVPEVMDGAEFLRRYGGTSDPVTRVDPARTYAVRQPTAHPIYEHDRVRRLRTLLETGAATERQRLQLGELMYQSHASYGTCGLGSAGTDLLVSMVRDAGPVSGLYGAKITGGGSGGVVAVLARAGSRAIVERMAREYERLTGHAAAVLGGSSDGAARFGIARLSR